MTLIVVLCTIVYGFFISKNVSVRLTFYSFISSTYILAGSVAFFIKRKQSKLYYIFSILTFILFISLIFRGIKCIQLGSQIINIYHSFPLNQITLVIYFLVSYSSAIFILLIIKEENQKHMIEDNKVLDQVNSTKDKIMSVMAHDLRNHFNAILGFSNIMKEVDFDLSSPEGKQYINILNEQAEDTNGLLESLLTWSRSQSNQLTYLPENIDLEEIISDTLESLQNVANLKNIKITFSNLGSNHIYADKNMLTTVLRNLVSNSIKFTPSKGKIDVTILERLDNFEFTVKDNGVGLKGDQIYKLFNSNVNSSSPGTNNEKGTGLGLLLCKEFVEKHGGKIWAHSKPGKGSEFIFTIPKMT